MANEFYALLGRMRNITRWGLMRNTFSENIAEHSYMTAVLAHALALIRNEKFGGRADPGAVAAAALVRKRLRKKRAASCSFRLSSFAETMPR